MRHCCLDRPYSDGYRNWRNGSSRTQRRYKQPGLPLLFRTDEDILKKAENFSVFRSFAHPHLDLSESGRRGTVRDMHGLHRFTLAAVRDTPDTPVSSIADGIARIPKFRRYTGVNRIFIHLSQFTILDLPGALDSKLEIEPLVIYRPALVEYPGGCRAWYRR